MKTLKSVKSVDLGNWEKQIMTEIVTNTNPSSPAKANLYKFLMQRAMTELISTLKLHQNIKIT